MDNRFIYSVEQQEVANTVMKNSYWWMTLALLITGGTAFGVANSEVLMNLIFASRGMLLGLCIAELALVFVLSGALHKLSLNAAIGCFLGYSILNGVTMSSILFVYTKESVAGVFLISATMFAALALYGTTTQRDLSGIGRFAFMALIGLIVASIVNIFMHSSGLYMLINYAGVLLFCGLTAYDAQKIQALAYNADPTHPDTPKLSILAALTLYLDFINLFLYLIRILGSRRD